MRFYFIRHGQSANNALWEATRSSNGRSEDPELTEVGQQQARYLAKFFAREVLETGQTDSGLSHLYTSLFHRAAATAETLAQAMGLRPQAWVEAHEWGGVYFDDPVTGQSVGLPGKPRSFFEGAFPSLVVPDWLDESGWWRSRPHETRAETWQRARSLWEALLARHGHTEDRVGLVSHGGFYNVLLYAVLGMPEAQVMGNMENDVLWFLLNNTAVTRLDVHDGSTVVAYMNRIDHLPPDLIT